MKINGGPKPIARVPYEHMTFVWVADHYDIHLKGLCRFGGKLCRFETDYPLNQRRARSRIYALSFIEKSKWLVRKRAFEICVGTHWTYPNRPNGASFKRRKPRWLSRFLFAAFYRINTGRWTWLPR